MSCLFLMTSNTWNLHLLYVSASFICLGGPLASTSSTMYTWCFSYSTDSLWLSSFYSIYSSSKSESVLLCLIIYLAKVTKRGLLALREHLLIADSYALEVSQTSSPAADTPEAWSPYMNFLSSGAHYWPICGADSNGIEGRGFWLAWWLMLLIYFCCLVPAILSCSSVQSSLWRQMLRPGCGLPCWALHLLGWWDFSPSLLSPSPGAVRDPCSPSCPSPISAVN